MPPVSYPVTGPSGEDPKVNLARVIRQAREDRGWNQDELAEKADVSRPTVQRLENAKIGVPNPETTRRVFRALGLDTRLIPVLLGYVTAEELGLPAELPRVFNPTTEQVIAILEDDDTPPALKAEALHYLRFRTQQESAGGAGSERHAS